MSKWAKTWCFIKVQDIIETMQKKVSEKLIPKEKYDISKLGGYQRNQQEKR